LVLYTFTDLSCLNESERRRVLAMLAIKAIKQNYVPTREVFGLLEAFRRMLNDCIPIGLAENVLCDV